MTTSTIATNIKKLREARHWSQEELALAAGVDARTVQRAEAGRPLSVDTLKSLAAAFDTTIEGLQVSDEAIEAALREFRQKYKIIEMQVATQSSDIGTLLGATEAIMLQRAGELTEQQLDSIAEFEATLRDYLDIWRSLGAVSQREGEKTLFELVTSLAAAGVSVSFGTETMGLRMGNGEATRMSVLHIALAGGTTPLRALVREKNMPISLTF